MQRKKKENERKKAKPRNFNGLQLSTSSLDSSSSFTFPSARKELPNKFSAEIMFPKCYTRLIAKSRYKIYIDRRERRNKSNKNDTDKWLHQQRQSNKQIIQRVSRVSYQNDNDKEQEQKKEKQKAKKYKKKKKERRKQNDIGRRSVKALNGIQR